MKNADRPATIKRRIWHRWLKPVLVILLVVGSFRSAVADWNDVPTGSMQPTILIGDRIFVNKLAYDLRVPFTTWRIASWGGPERGDVVVLISPHDGKRLVKRVIAEPGDRLAIHGKRVWLNGRQLEYELVEEVRDADPAMILEEELGDGHAIRLDRRRALRADLGEVEVPPGQYFVMGDNRDNSLDSRFFGFVARDRFLGKAEGVVLSVDFEDGLRPRWERFFSSLR